MAVIIRDLQPLSSSDTAFMLVGAVALIAMALWALYAFVKRRKEQSLWI